MSGPGKGRYTTYVPIQSERNKILWKLFNGKASGAGTIYGKETFDNKEAAAAAVATATAPVKNGVGGLLPSDGKQAGDIGMFSKDVDLSYGDAPNTEDVKWSSAGGPAIPYAPDVSSPGPGAAGQVRTDGKDKDQNPGLSVGDFKPGYVQGPNTVSPADTSPVVGKSVFTKDLDPGKSGI